MHGAPARPLFLRSGSTSFGDAAHRRAQEELRGWQRRPQQQPCVGAIAAPLRSLCYYPRSSRRAQLCRAAAAQSLRLWRLSASFLPTTPRMARTGCTPRRATRITMAKLASSTPRSTACTNYSYRTSRARSRPGRELSAQFQHARPFPHVVIDNALPDAYSGGRLPFFSHVTGDPQPHKRKTWSHDPTLRSWATLTSVV